MVVTRACHWARAVCRSPSIWNQMKVEMSAVPKRNAAR
jgi:hypothetical protein